MTVIYWECRWIVQSKWINVIEEKIALHLPFSEVIWLEYNLNAILYHNFDWTIWRHTGARLCETISRNALADFVDDDNDELKEWKVKKKIEKKKRNMPTRSLCQRIGFIFIAAFIVVALLECCMCLCFVANWFIKQSIWSILQKSTLCVHGILKRQCKFLPMNSMYYFEWHWNELFCNKNDDDNDDRIDRQHLPRYLANHILASVCTRANCFVFVFGGDCRNTEKKNRWHRTNTKKKQRIGRLK